MKHFVDELKAHERAFLYYSEDMFRGLFRKTSVIAKWRAKVSFRSTVEVEIEC